MGIFEITTSEAILNTTHTIRCVLMMGKKGAMNVWAQNVHHFAFNIPYPNILRWAAIFRISIIFLLSSTESGTDSVFLMTLKRIRPRSL